MWCVSTTAVVIVLTILQKKVSGAQLNGWYLSKILCLSNSLLLGIFPRVLLRAEKGYEFRVILSSVRPQV